MHGRVHHTALVDERTARLAASIGARVRRERTGRSWTLDQLAEVAGVSRRMVVNVEQGATNPSVGTLLRLSAAFGIGLAELVDLPAPARAAVTRAGSGSVLWTGPAGGTGLLLAAAQPHGVGELWEWTLQPGEQHESEAHPAGTQELLQVHTGTLRLVIDQQVEILQPGDAIAFAGDVPHAYGTAGETAVQFSLAVFDPSATRTPTEGPLHG